MLRAMRQDTPSSRIHWLAASGMNAPNAPTATYRRFVFQEHASEHHVIPRDIGVTTIAEVRRMIESRVGQMATLVFRTSPARSAHVVAFVGQTTDGRVSTGTMVLHAKGRSTRLECIAQRGRGLVRRLRDEPNSASPELVAAVAALVEEVGAVSESLRAVDPDAIANAGRELLRWMFEHPERSTPEMRAELWKVLDRTELG